MGNMGPQIHLRSTTAMILTNRGNLFFVLTQNPSSSSLCGSTSLYFITIELSLSISLAIMTLGLCPHSLEARERAPFRKIQGKD